MIGAIEEMKRKILYEIDFILDTVDKDIAVNLVKHVIEVFSMNAKSKVEEVIELAEVKKWSCLIFRL